MITRVVTPAPQELTGPVLPSEVDLDLHIHPAGRRDRRGRQHQSGIGKTLILLCQDVTS